MELPVGTSDKPVVLVFAQYYLPGYRAGGPVRSIEGIVDRLGDFFDLRIVTSDRDLGDTSPFDGIVPGEWTRVGRAWVMYLSPRQRTPWMCIRILRETPWQLLYLNSFFSRFFSILPVILLRVLSLNKGCVLLAPRGEFGLGSLGLHWIRKRVFITLGLWLGLYKELYFHASSEYESIDIQRELSPRLTYRATPLFAQKKVFEARDVRGGPSGMVDPRRRQPKRPGTLKLVYISRISRVKNLLGAIRLVASLRGDVEFNIYGPMEDREYWRACQKEIAKLPECVHVSYRGTIPHADVMRALLDNHIFLLPTLGENYGHIIHEALLSGCPVLLSDRTLWRDLEQQGIGWDLPLDAPERFVAVLQHCLAMGEEEYAAMSERAANAGVVASDDFAAVYDNRLMFESLVSATEIG